jgi:hypothetical protein
MSGSNAAGQQPTNVTQQLVNNTSAINRKVDQLADIIAGLSINDDVREAIERQLQGIKAKEVVVKLKALEHYDGMSRPLRSWLTEAELHMENKGIVGEEARTRFIGGHLKGRAWNWFEPFARERSERPQDEWSDRTTRVFSSYRELRKAMTQVFGDIDERKTAARELQRLRQTASVRSYITEFQTITANLEWDDEALEDKFQEGLKQNIRDALIFFPTEPKNLEELFERAQKIDREQWSGRNNHDWPRARNKGSYPRNRNDQPRVKYDRQGDVIMTGAKVNLEEAKKTGACFKCGKKGHYSRNCRQKTPRDAYGTPRDGNIIRMVRVEEFSQHDTNRTASETGTDLFDITKDEESTTEETDKSLDVSAVSQGLTEDDFESTEQESDMETEGIDWNELKTQDHARDNGERYMMYGWLKRTNHSVDRKETAERDNSDKQESARNRDDDSITGHSSKRIQESPLLFREELMANRHPSTIVGEFTGKAKGRLNAVDYSKLSRKTPVWKEYCEQRATDTVEEYQKWYSKMEMNDRFCRCYGYDPKCWAQTGYTWMKHLSECRKCERWSEQECNLPGHSAKSKKTTLIDVSERRNIPDVTKTNEGTTCCEEEVCLHQFLEHGKIDVPWWACYNRECAEHYKMKLKNGGSPRIPMITMLRNDKCPCLRRGCICGMNQRHQFHRGLLTVKQCQNEQCTLHDDETTTVYELDKEVEIFRREIQQATKELRNLRGTYRIGKIAESSQTKQMEATVSVFGKEMKTIIDSGADINYVNRRWCEEKGIRYKETGFGKIRAYDDTYVQDYIRKTTFEFEIQGKTQRQIFHVLSETGQDNMVLGMPWLESENPEIDWKERTVLIREKPRKTLSNGQGSKERGLALRFDESRTRQNRNIAQEKGKPELATIREEGPDLRRIGRASLSHDQPHPDVEGKKKEKEHETELEEIKKVLPRELWGYEKVFTETK